ncbi:hypothetical protein HSBAA_48910 [Vreelandella sulfidaeris]|uniref:Uncharacterized protein n=1 Tax=Vreelandella sulfidaeris TaxID=115553 RepID=A0A455UC15_9GAMM|nr:hypothetical protein HSBAA_48910 [Halomonas sulfidaeris]
MMGINTTRGNAMQSTNTSSPTRRWLMIGVLGAGICGLPLAYAASDDVILESLQTDHLNLSLERVANGFEHPWG